MGLGFGMGIMIEITVCELVPISHLTGEGVPTEISILA